MDSLTIPIVMNLPIEQGEEFSNISAKRQAKKLARKQKRAQRKLNRQQRKAERQQRRAERKAKRKGGIPLTEEELIDEEVDLEESKEDGDSEDEKEISREKKESEKFPKWAKVAIGIGGGLILIGIATVVIVKLNKK